MIRRMMMAGLKNGGDTPDLVQAVNINFDDTDRGAITGWNNIIGAATNSLNLLNSLGAATGFNLQFVAGDFTAEDEGAQTDPFSRFPSSVLKYMINRNNSPISFKFTGLSAVKNYRLKFAAVQFYDDPGDATTVTLNGTPYDLGGPNLANVVYPTTDIYYSVNLPVSGEITMVFSPTSIGGYTCINAMIIEEFNP